LFQEHFMRARLIALASVIALTAGCAGSSPPEDSPQASIGAAPELPSPQKKAIPTLKIAPATSWAPGEKPSAPAGFSAARFAEGLDHPRELYVLPNGDVLVAESSSEPGKVTGIRGWVQQLTQKRAGALHTSANRITLLRDADGDGTAETKTSFLTGLNQPFGMTLIGDTFYVANTDAVVSVPYKTGQTQITAQPTTVLRLPYYAPDNHHWTRSLTAGADGRKLYVSVGSASNIAEKGIDVEEKRAAILEFNRDGSGERVFASGLRNPNGLSWEPKTGALWTVVNERDEIGDNLVPDYMTSVKDGGFYGWPYSYFGQHVDVRVKPQRPDLVAAAIAPDYALGAHTASLGLTFYNGNTYPARYAGGAFIGQHGSWNRSQLAGYKVAFVPFANGKPAGPLEDFLTGFVNDKGDARGRPVGVTVDRSGALLVADDVGNIVWRVAADNGKSIPVAAR
jgi:glucose/arabinose dehydrogenase